MATTRDRSAVMMRRFLVGGVVAWHFGSDDDEDDDNIVHFDLRGLAAAVRYSTRVSITYSSLVNITPVPNSRVLTQKHIQKLAPKFVKEPDTAFETSYAKRQYFFRFFLRVDTACRR